MIDINNIEFHLGEYFRGELDTGSIAEIEQWIGESPANREQALQVCRLEMSLSELHQGFEADTEAALRSVSSRIWKRRTSRVVKIIQQVAAALLLPLLAAGGYYAYQFHHIDESEYILVKTTTGMVSSVVLPDSSKVWLNSNSELRYPVRFAGRTRSVNLKGEAFFDVEKSEGRKFVVNAGDIQVEVLGTEFNVEAYPEKGRVTRTTLVSGSVRMSYVSEHGQEQKVSMLPGQQASYDSESGSVRLIEVNTAIASSWKDGRIVLDDTPLADALRMIENRYNVKFLIRNKDLLRNRYTGLFEDQRLEVILDHFRKTTDMVFDTEVTGTESQESVSGRSGHGCMAQLCESLRDTLQRESHDVGDLE